MKISEGTKISELIKFNPNVIEAIASINPHFEKLKNPILRKVLASRVTIKDAAKIGGCSVDVFFAKLSPLGFSHAGAFVNLPGDEVPSGFSIPKNARITSLDVRQDIKSGKDPFLKIISALDGVGFNDYLEVINSFEPVPLIKILKEKNYDCSLRKEGHVIYTYIHKKETSLPMQARKTDPNAIFDKKLSEYGNSLRQLDVSKMEMPGPMLSILKELESLPADFALHVKHRRVPQLLLPELKDRGINILIKQIQESNVELLIFK
jgi:hypothetical protein